MPFNNTLGFGGVIAIRASSVALAGTIDASNIGFPGGAIGNLPQGAIGASMGGGGGGGASGHGCFDDDSGTGTNGPVNLPGVGADGSRDGDIDYGIGGGCLASAPLLQQYTCHRLCA